MSRNAAVRVPCSLGQRNVKRAYVTLLRCTAYSMRYLPPTYSHRHGISYIHMPKVKTDYTERGHEGGEREKQCGGCDSLMV
jgi:hypothetical protein